MFYTILLAVHIIVTLLLVGIILLQRSDGDGLSMTGSMNSMMAGRSSGNLLTRTTTILAAVFILTSLGLNMTHQKSASTSIVDQIVEEKPAAVPEPAKPAPAPSVPLKE